MAKAPRRAMVNIKPGQSIGKPREVDLSQPVVRYRSDKKKGRLNILESLVRGRKVRYEMDIKKGEINWDRTFRKRDAKVEMKKEARNIGITAVIGAGGGAAIGLATGTSIAAGTGLGLIFLPVTYIVIRVLGRSYGRFGRGTDL